MIWAKTRNIYNFQHVTWIFQYLTVIVIYDRLFHLHPNRENNYRETKIANLEFKIGENGVYPAHGVVKVEGIEDKEICGNKESFYILNVYDSDVTVMVPTDNVESVGLRPIINKNEVPSIYDILGTEDDGNGSKNGNKSWNKRYREYSDKLNSGDIFEVAAVLKDIHLLQNEKDLSFGERRIMESARALLVKEVSLAKKVDEGAVEEEVTELLSIHVIEKEED